MASLRCRFGRQMPSAGRRHSQAPLRKPMDPIRASWRLTGRRKPSLFLHSQKARQLAFAVEKPEVVGCFRSFRVIIRDPRTESPVS